MVIDITIFNENLARKQRYPSQKRKQIVLSDITGHVGMRIFSAIGVKTITPDARQRYLHRHRLRLWR